MSIVGDVKGEVYTGRVCAMSKNKKCQIHHNNFEVGKSNYKQQILGYLFHVTLFSKQKNRLSATQTLTPKQDVWLTAHFVFC